MRAVSGVFAAPCRYMLEVVADQVVVQRAIPALHQHSLGLLLRLLVVTTGAWLLITAAR